MIPLATLVSSAHSDAAATGGTAGPWWLVLGLSTVSLVVSLLVRSRERSELAERVLAPQIRRRGRYGIGAALLLALAWRLSLGVDSGWPWLEISAASAALLALIVAPAETDRVLAQKGVRIGYHVRRFAVLEEWRLTGEHLRVRLFGEWTALPVPPAHQEQLRKQLEAEAPERESRFKG
jgi:heme exporter protein D